MRQRQRNAALSKIRCGVETVFAVLKRIYGSRRTRYTGLVRNELQLTLLAICFNLRRMLVLSSPCSGVLVRNMSRQPKMHRLQPAP